MDAVHAVAAIARYRAGAKGCRPTGRRLLFIQVRTCRMLAVGVQLGHSTLRRIARCSNRRPGPTPTPSGSPALGGDKIQQVVFGEDMDRARRITG